MDRTTFKLMASGKYLDLNKSFNQDQHTSFIEGAMFAYDLVSHINKTKELESKKVIIEPKKISDNETN